MIRKLLALLFHRQVLAPIAPTKFPAWTICCHCGAAASETWWPGLCSLASEQKEWMPVCAVCDVEINEIVVRFLYGNEKDHLLAAYRTKRLS